MVSDCRGDARVALLMRNRGYGLIARVPAECVRAAWPERTRAGIQGPHA